MIALLSGLSFGLVPIGVDGNSLVSFDFFMVGNLWLLVNFILTGLAGGVIYIVVYHAAMQNSELSKRDVFAILIGPAIGLLMIFAGGTQFEILQWTLGLNFGSLSIKSLLKKVGVDIQNGEVTPAPVTVIAAGTNATTKSNNTYPEV